MYILYLKKICHCCVKNCILCCYDLCVKIINVTIYFINYDGNIAAKVNYVGNGNKQSERLLFGIAWHMAIGKGEAQFASMDCWGIPHDHLDLLLLLRSSLLFCLPSLGTCTISNRMSVSYFSLYS